MLDLISQYEETLKAYKSGKQILFCIYYDDPGSIVDWSTMRMELGFFFQTKDD